MQSHRDDARRGVLILKQVKGTLTEEEAKELSKLQEKTSKNIKKSLQPAIDYMKGKYFGEGGKDCVP